ncbi:XAC2610-related protein [Flavobacterium sp. FlaQc-57]|uniref:XAC2610-related protein n=1 Tax=Flavobacterium sp. FlaQc-57 TaxID=3374186 RepID=UPI003756482C
MKNIILLLIYLVFPKIALGQTCLHKNLSKEFNFEIKVRKIKNPKEEIDSNTVKIIVHNKITNKKQEINFGSSFLFEKTFINCKTVRSYSTGINKNSEIIDNDFGDLIIADFNFDNKEDFAVKNDSGGNGGPTYNFYIQDKNKNFALDPFLTSEMEFFPSKFIVKNKRLITYVHANAYQLSENIFEYNEKLKKWNFKESKLVTP